MPETTLWIQNVSSDFNLQNITCRAENEAGLSEDVARLNVTCKGGGREGTLVLPVCPLPASAHTGLLPAQPLPGGSALHSSAEPWQAQHPLEQTPPSHARTWGAAGGASSRLPAEPVGLLPALRPPPCWALPRLQILGLACPEGPSARDQPDPPVSPQFPL